MQLEHIALFKKVAEAKSISKVAQVSHLSQPALSLQMQRLEDEIGQKLFERSNKGIELTPAGNILLKYAEEFNAIHDSFIRDIEQLQNAESPFTIAAFPDAANYAIPCTLFTANKVFPSYTFYLSSMPNEEVIRAIKYGRADIGFIIGSPAGDELLCQKAFSDRVYLVAHNSYHTARIKHLSDICKLPLLMLNDQLHKQHPLLIFLAEHGYSVDDLTIASRFDTTESIKSGVAARHGIAFMPYMAIKQELYLKQFKIIELEDFDFHYEINLISKPLTDVSDVCKKDIINYVISIAEKSIC